MSTNCFKSNKYATHLINRGVHEITLVDMGGHIRAGCVYCLSLSTPVAVANTSLSWLQPELEQLRHRCKKRYCRSQADGCSYCGKRIKLDMARHVVKYNLELAQLWRCPVSWCTIWKGMPQDCMDHLRLAHVVPASVRTANLGKWFPPWTVTCQTWKEALNPRISGVSTDVLLFSECGHALVHHYRIFRKGISNVSLRVIYLDNLRISVTQSAAIGWWGQNEDKTQSSPVHGILTSPRSIRPRDSDEESPCCKIRQARSPRMTDVLALLMSPTAVDPTRSSMMAGRPYCQCQSFWLIWRGMTSW